MSVNLNSSLAVIGGGFAVVSLFALEGVSSNMETTPTFSSIASSVIGSSAASFLGIPLSGYIANELSFGKSLKQRVFSLAMGSVTVFAVALVAKTIVTAIF